MEVTLPLVKTNQQTPSFTSLYLLALVCKHFLPCMALLSSFLSARLDAAPFMNCWIKAYLISKLSLENFNSIDDNYEYLLSGYNNSLHTVSILQVLTHIILKVTLIGRYRYHYHPFSKWGNRGRKRLRNMHKSTWLISDKAGIWSQAIRLYSWILKHVVMSYVQKNQTGLLSHTIYLNNSKWIKDLNVVLNHNNPGRKHRQYALWHWC